MTEQANGRVVGLWRGINVGTAKRIKMAELREVLEGLGCEEVRTLLNSGNAVLRPPKGEHDLGSQIEEEVALRLGVRSRVTTLTARRFAQLLDDNSLLQSDLAPQIEAKPANLVAHVYAEPDVADEMRAFARQDWNDERLAVGRHATYCWLPAGQSKSLLAVTIARPCKDRVTSRNWSTMRRIAALLQD